MGTPRVMIETGGHATGTHLTTRCARRWAGERIECETARARLRLLVAGDARSIATRLGQVDVRRYLAPGPVTEDDAARFIAWTRRECRARRYLTLGVVPKAIGEVAGLFQIWPITADGTTSEWGFALESSLWGTGLFHECADAIADLAFDTLGVHRLEGRAAVDNARGNGALRKLGATREGIMRQCFQCQDGELRDHVMWSLLVTDRRRRSASPATARLRLVHPSDPTPGWTGSRGPAARAGR